MAAAARVAATALQYSKRLSKFICWMWAMYRFAVLVVAAIEPSIANAVANTIPGVDTIMLVNVSTYMVNSLGEKYIYSDKFVLKWLDRGGFKHLLGRAKSAITEDSDGGEEYGDDNNG